MTQVRPPVPPVPRLPTETPERVRVRARGRARLVGTLLLLGLGAIAAQGVGLVLSPDPRTLEVSATKRWRAVPVEGQRGAVVTQDGTVLATSVRHPSIHVDPVAVREQAGERGGVPVDEVARRLAQAVGLPYAEVRALMDRPGRYERVAIDVHPEVASRVEDLGLLRRGVIVSQGFRRFYPQGPFASQLVGFVDGAGTGRQGLEARFHEDLVGAEIVSQRRVNRWGGVLDGVEAAPPEAVGRTVHTTIDRVVQQATETALARILEAHAPVAATAVVVEVATGRVLAMASAPAFDPNRVDEIPSTDFTRTQNLAVTALYEPGSVIKPFTMAAALEAGVITPDDVIETGPTLVVAGKTIRDDHPHDRVTVDEMVKYSSNIAAAKIGRAAGEENLLDTFARFGFGQRSGVDTQGELAGRRRPGGRFGPVELANVSFGQGITTTTLQLALATGAIANGGTLMRPLLVDRLTDGTGRVVKSWVPEKVGRAVSPDTAGKVTHAMELVLQEGGTGTRAAIPGYRVAGKTGTAQKVKDGVYSSARVSTFVGFAPADRPVLAMAILVDEPTIGSRYGGIVAAPAFASVIGTALRHLDVPPDTAPVPAATDDLLPVADLPPDEAVRVAWDAQAGAWRMPDLHGRPLRDALAAVGDLGAALTVEGSGVLVEQRPGVGDRLAPGDRVHLVFR